MAGTLCRVMLGAAWVLMSVRDSLAERPTSNEDFDLAFARVGGQMGPTGLLERKLEINHTSLELESDLPRGWFMFMAQSKQEMEEYGADSFLSAKGIEMVRTRVQTMKTQCDDCYKFLQSVKEVLVAPRASSILTALLAVALAWSDPTMAGKQMPSFRVSPYLRERGGYFVPSEHDVRNAKQQVMEWTQRQCTEILGPAKANALDAAVEILVWGYKTFIKTQHTQVRAAGNAIGMYHYIHQMKYELYKSKQNILMVADRELGTHMFMAGLPNKKEEEENPSQNLQLLMRKNVQQLNYAGVVRAEWTVSRFQQNGALDKNTIDGHYTIPFLRMIVCGAEQLATRGLPNLDKKNSINVPFDAKQAVHSEIHLAKGVNGKLLPDHSLWSTFYLQKTKWYPILKRYSGTYERLLNVVAEPIGSGTPQAYRASISWLTAFGDQAKGLIDLANVDVEMISEGDLKGAVKMSDRNSKRNGHWILQEVPGVENQAQWFVNYVTQLKKLVRGEIQRGGGPTQTVVEIADTDDETEV
eukprot:CAMPEP_0178379816 /NCGR_PEP_ID=MMETSP0689_2-20121128/5141_1 /TAXON_ID=160604 /ORGANISM="Amphidinium massartii, Strain CS-259" /LENGTH=526 /DNA_ID=CAMNT_0019999937 /DNA_START=73 /DNA_END=1649 /DNA_ORIENTATION=+